MGAPSSPRSPPSSRCVSPRRSTTRPGHRLYVVFLCVQHIGRTLAESAALRCPSCSDLFPGWHVSYIVLENAAGAPQVLLVVFLTALSCSRLSSVDTLVAAPEGVDAPPRV